MKSKGLITKQECFFGREGSGSGSGISFVPMTWHNVQKTSAFNHFFFRSLYIYSHFPFTLPRHRGRRRASKYFGIFLWTWSFGGFQLNNCIFRFCRRQNDPVNRSFLSYLALLDLVVNDEAKRCFHQNGLILFQRFHCLGSMQRKFARFSLRNSQIGRKQRHYFDANLCIWPRIPIEPDSQIQTLCSSLWNKIQPSDSS